MSETHTINDITLFDIKQFTRATIADGKMLNQYIFAPLSANNDILASAVGSAYNDSVHYTAQTKTTAEKVQARNNIGAISLDDISAKSEIKVYNGAETVNQGVMTVYTSGNNVSGATVPLTFDNINDSNVSLIKMPVVGDAGKVLTVQENSDHTSAWFNWSDLSFNTYTANITYNASTNTYTSAMPSAYYDDMIQKIKNNEQVAIMLTTVRAAPYNTFAHYHLLQAQLQVNAKKIENIKSLTFSTLTTDANGVSKVLSLSATDSTTWSYAENALAFDGNYVSAGNNQTLSMITASQLPMYLQQNTIYIV